MINILSRRNFSRNHILFLLFLLLVPIIFVVIFWTVSSIRNVVYEKEFLLAIKSDEILLKKQNLVLEAIDRIGPRNTWKLLKEAYLNENRVAGHTLAHYFGDGLYKKFGVNGMLYCALDFDFGCYHGFFITAIPSEGLDVIHEADEACVEKFGKDGFGCQHGIGHGVLEYMGYEKLNEALDACGTLTFRGKIFGCQDGVFMDYNFPPTIEKDGTIGVSIREFDESNPYHPCDKVNNRYKDSCYYGLAQWLLSAYNNDFDKVKVICGGIIDRQYRSTCLLGLGGSIAVISNYSAKESSSLCNRMTESVERTLCMTAVAWVVFAVSPDGDQSYRKVCESLADISEKNYCIRNYNLYDIYGLKKQRVEEVLPL